MIITTVSKCELEVNLSLLEFFFVFVERLGKFFIELHCIRGNLRHAEVKVFLISHRLEDERLRLEFAAIGMWLSLILDNNIKSNTFFQLSIILLEIILQIMQ